MSGNNSKLNEFRQSLRRGLGQGVGFGIGLSLTVLTTVLVAQLPFEFQSGDLLSAAQINANFDQLAQEAQSNHDRINTLVGQLSTLETTETTNHTTNLTSITNIQNNVVPPIGTIMAWTTDINGTPTTLPPNWVLCDGNPITVTGSPMIGETTPNLNGERRFLRGGTTSGTPEADAFQGHAHQSSINIWQFQSYLFPDGNGLVTPFAGSSQAIVNIAFSTGDPVATGYGAPRIASETRPANMSVIWIMRVL